MWLVVGMYVLKGVKTDLRKECIVPVGPSGIDDGHQEWGDGTQRAAGEYGVHHRHFIDEDAGGQVGDDAEHDVGEDPDRRLQCGEVLDFLEADVNVSSCKL